MPHLKANIIHFSAKFLSFSAVLFLLAVATIFLNVNAVQAQAAPIFQDNFESGGLGGAQGGIWYNPVRAAVSSENPRTGSYSLKFTYPGSADLAADSSSEIRGRFPNTPSNEVWMEWYVRVPENYEHRTPIGTSNNKFWILGYGDNLHDGWIGAPGGWTMRMEVDRSGTAGAISRTSYAYGNEASGGSSYNANGTGPAFIPYGSVITTADLGTWVRYGVHLKLTTSIAASNAEVHLYKNGQLVSSHTGYPIGGVNFSNPIDCFELMGWANSGFNQETIFYIDDVNIYNTDPGWSGTPPPSDSQAPSVPSNFSATAASTSQINLSWSASSDNVGVTGYRIYRNGSQIATTASTTYSNTGLTASTTYSYTVAAYDAAGNASAQSASASATTLAGGGGDTTPPVRSNGSPTGVLPAGTTSTTLSVTTNEAATCRFAITTGQAYINMPYGPFTGAGSTSHTYTITGLTNGNSYNAYVRCQDTAGNANTDDYNISFSVASQSADSQAPTVPSNLSATAASSSQINLSWTASSDNVGVTGYRIYRNGSQIATTSSTSYSNTGLSASTTYSYTVAAYDAAGNASAQSASDSATTLAAADTTPPTVSITAPTASQVFSTSTTQVTLSATTNENATCRWATTNMAYSSMTNTFTTTGGTSHSTTLSGLTNGSSYARYVRCSDAAGNPTTTSQSVAFSVAADTQAPNIPTGLSALATSSSQISISWNASADNVGVTGYRLYRNGSQIVNTSNTSYIDTGLSASTSYSYRVAAYDAAGNLSSQSSAASATTQAPPIQPDSQAPTPPTSLRTVSTPGTTSIALAWDASTDNISVSLYRIYRNNTLIGTSGDSTYYDTGLTASTSYSYQVSAIDPTGNESARTSSFSVTTAQVVVNPGPGGGGGGSVNPTPNIPTPTAPNTPTDPNRPPVTTDANHIYLTGMLVKYADNPTVYVIDANTKTKRPLTDWGVYKYSFGTRPIVTAPNNAALDNYATVSQVFTFQPGSIIKTADNPTVWYILENGTKYGFKSAEEFRAFGFDFPQVQVTTPIEINYFPESTIQSLRYHASNQFIRYEGQPTVYQIINGVKYPIPAWSVLLAHTDPKFVAVVPNTFSYQYPTGTTISYPEGTMLRAQDSLTVYIVENGLKRPFTTANAFNSRGFQFHQVLVVPTTDLNLLSEGNHITE